jgi:hypothetical protein
MEEDAANSAANADPPDAYTNVEIFEELYQLESETTDWEALREEFDQEVEQYAASDEDGWFYEDEEK